MDNPINLVKTFELPVFVDQRGFLLKAVMNEFVGDRQFGEIYFVESAPGIVRANHYHRLATEWFVVIKGEALLRLASTSEPTLQKEITMNASQPICVMIPPGVAHALIATGTEPMLMMALADKGYDPSDTDTYPFDFELTPNTKE